MFGEKVHKYPKRTIQIAEMKINFFLPNLSARVLKIIDPIADPIKRLEVAR